MNLYNIFLKNSRNNRINCNYPRFCELIATATKGLFVCREPIPSLIKLSI